MEKPREVLKIIRVYKKPFLINSSWQAIFPEIASNDHLESCVQIYVLVKITSLDHKIVYIFTIYNYFIDAVSLVNFFVYWYYN